MVCGLDGNAHLLEGNDDLAADVFTQVNGREVEVAGAIVGLGGGAAIAAQEQEELDLGSRHHREAAVRSLGNDVLERGARAAGERAAVGIGNVADQPADPRAVGIGPRKHLEGRQVWPQVHVRLFNADEAFDRRAVKHDLAVERFGKLAVGDLDVLDDAENVGELQAQELDAFLFGPFKDGSLQTHLSNLVTSSIRAAASMGLVRYTLAPSRSDRSSLDDRSAPDTTTTGMRASFSFDLSRASTS